mmetsp:Transcript_6413/g.40042  ORF Transcript_6413/g.40042 Transcript_6413/m.40042 type:complete len:228 (+) Transcript_6413:4527-5210(+)|eukprot:CAMPEP_0183823826 /NCGR_PEP_ID=MMETSP0807_2-20130328/255_1 /TAXON_ID=88271 /ORGANISM="Picocystis salinarum, Strain CCMP1897" /LENGTH=227 /DNA_ID=CAMNT_0026068731 /DNA_START=4456 /DNA_END=5142 /DNA_ORIENTATION=+
MHTNVWATNRGFGRHPNEGHKRKEKEHPQSLGKRCAIKLKGCNVVVVGDCTTGNAALAQQLAKELEYVPLQTSELIRNVMQTQAEEQEELDQDAWELSVRAEILLLEEVAFNARCAVGTLGGGGAAARGDFWRFLFGAYTIWLDYDEGNPNIQQRDAYEMAELHVKVRRDPGVSEAETGRALAGEVLDRLFTLLEENEEIPKKKSLYVRLGARGDWPDLREPEWNPT